MSDDDGLVIGTTSTALGSLGASPGSDWYAWELAGKAPRSLDGNGTAHRYGEDAALLAEHGITAHRVVIDWTTVAPKPGRLDPAAMERERERLSALVHCGIAPWVALHHIALPGWFVDDGGFADDHARGRHWPRYVDEVAQELGDLVAGWFPILEPTRWARAAFVDGRRPPGRTEPELFAKALRGIWLAWLDAWRQLRGSSAPVATAIDLAPVRAADETIPALQRARRHDHLIWTVAINALRDGVLDIPGLAIEEVPDLRDSADIIGFTYRGGLTIPATGAFGPYPLDAPQPWVEGFADTLHRLAEALPSRRYAIAEHGVGTDDDDRRADLIDRTMAQLRDVQGDGIDVCAYFYHGAIDGYEPSTGFVTPWGVFDRDRNARGSAEVLARAGTLA